MHAKEKYIYIEVVLLSLNKVKFDMMYVTHT